MQKLLLFIDATSTLLGKIAAWAVVALTALISWEVFSRYALNAPSSVTETARTVRRTGWLGERPSTV